MSFPESRLEGMSAATNTSGFSSKSTRSSKKSPVKNETCKTSILQIAYFPSHFLLASLPGWLQYFSHTRAERSMIDQVSIGSQTRAFISRISDIQIFLIISLICLPRFRPTFSSTQARATGRSKKVLDDNRSEDGQKLPDLDRLEHRNDHLENQKDKIIPHSSIGRRVSITSVLKDGLPRLFILSKSQKQLLLFLLPTFVQSRFLPRRIGQKRPLHPTAWLDVTRGIAAFCIFMDHLQYSNHDTNTAYGYGSSNYEWFKLPFLQFLHTGASQVAIFFAVSGYALSYRPVNQMRNEERDGLLTTLSSSVF